MILFDIQEPGETESYPIGKSIGIDLGTTNSLAAVSSNRQPVIIADKMSGEKILPSIVAFDNNRSYVGNDALNHSTYISSIKRLMGRGIEDIKGLHLPYDINQNSNQNLIQLNINNTVKDPIEISAEILKELKRRAEEYLGEKVENAVITVPAYFDDAARVATKNAAQIVGLKVLRLLNEPTAAAIAYSLDKNESGIFAVYDFGGGTFDVSILRLEKGIFQVLATGGDVELGGDELDKEIITYFTDQKLDINSLQVYLREARKIKEYLTDNTHWQGEILNQKYSLSQIEFNNLIKPYISKTIKIFKNVLKQAEIEVNDISEIILVGGSTRVPYVKAALTQAFDKKPLDTINPEEIVALGAAIQAEALTYGSDNILLDVTPLSLGIELMGGISEIIIPRNSPLPTQQKRMYTTHSDGQTGLKIHVIQGESEKVSECRSLAHFELKGLPQLPAGEPRIEITFKIDADGILTVTAYEKLTETKQEIEIKPAYGLKEEEVLSLLQKNNVI
ncbi:chaperone protein HscA [endosymbiont of Acanthamoeba sp. UWC8]|uniref:Fe-S protein assembly chaperone HscA n=1 Tax=endosymbiont of Acanthamoeba sp. UWC8 TaxID=86106 RepID=UPI0004D0EB9E|nr:Fe-S protein assembly chaperone HscA [endosymbiont of Acanthamoeba sp. UWC8]AIF81593.1 chaperone protein HscA [endosymbiont of Acanthamoeba sp. UWC8]